MVFPFICLSAAANMKNTSSCDRVPFKAGEIISHLASANGSLPNPSLSSYLPLKTPSPEELIFYRHIAHVTQKVEKLCFFKR